MLVIDSSIKSFVMWHDYSRQIPFDVECADDFLLEMMAAEIAFALWDSLEFQSHVTHQIWGRIVPIKTESLSEDECYKLLTEATVRFYENKDMVWLIGNIFGETPKGH